MCVRVIDTFGLCIDHRYMHRFREIVFNDGNGGTAWGHSKTL